ncbi:DUF4466 family protein [Dysgonomonas alginatilytica]|nr:DUF4466 family protein [Dysgonomonas alginatilytica]
MKRTKYIFLFIIFLGFASCSDDEDSSLKNDFIKKTVAPALVGEKIEFAYAAGTTSGRLATVEANASIAGAQGTEFGVHSYYTTRVALTTGGVNYKVGDDVPLKTVKETSTKGALSSATMEEKVDEIYVNPLVAFGTNKVDLIAATLRYYYVVPEEARGKEVSFSFSAKSTSGDNVNVRTPSYKVSKMEMKRLISLTIGKACYFSIADMKAYTKEEVESGNLSSKIDFVYLYQAKMGDYNYGHVAVSPGTDPKYIATPAAIPSSWTKNKTRMEKRVDVRDAQLKGSIPNVYIDDIDFQTLNLDSAVDYVFGFQQDEGAFMKSADGQYAAYIYVNSVNNNTGLVVSIKRYKL